MHLINTCVVLGLAKCPMYSIPLFVVFIRTAAVQRRRHVGS
uniref:Uncharacterized protein n=1 Tax=Arundo donax TaxID=35708 RepID=A0A0A8YVM4_ARUDO